MENAKIKMYHREAVSDNEINTQFTIKRGYKIDFGEGYIIKLKDGREYITAQIDKHEHSMHYHHNKCKTSSCYCTSLFKYAYDKERNMMITTCRFCFKE